MELTKAGFSNCENLLRKYDVHSGPPALDLDEFTALVKDILEVQQAQRCFGGP